MGKIKNQIRSTWQNSSNGEKMDIVFGVVDIISGAISLLVLGRTFFSKKDNADDNQEDED